MAQEKCVSEKELAEAVCAAVSAGELFPRAGAGVQGVIAAGGPHCDLIVIKKK